MSEYNKDDILVTQDMIKVMFEATQRQRLSTFTQLNKSAKKGGIVFVGDSITEGFPIHEMLQQQRN
ncbi:hypothetical protein [Paenibacillus segetis]|uniref:Uncharacterized protein n=1 Tax=Paenibacillus segetis TaxID=1325360 RepID=A0ABQ1YQP8_9BACL|nr:hypothetical protein [Paenibacillus segetis]GGH35125.1 hypothetical protein GCM10008013_41250 [Paenibacillus segetis]